MVSIRLETGRSFAPTPADRGTEPGSPDDRPVRQPKLTQYASNSFRGSCLKTPCEGRLAGRSRECPGGGEVRVRDPDDASPHPKAQASPRIQKDRPSLPR